MATSLKLRTPIIIGLSFLLMLVLMLIALPNWLSYLRPQLVVLTLLYWLLNLPQRVGLFVAWSLGLILDVVYNVTLGEHALILVLIAYASLNWQVRIQFFSFWQKLMLIFVLVFIYLLPQFYTDLTMGNTFNAWLYWLSPLVSALIWPYLVGCLDAMKRSCKVF